MHVFFMWLFLPQNTLYINTSTTYYKRPYWEKATVHFTDEPIFFYELKQYTALSVYFPA